MKPHVLCVRTCRNCDEIFTTYERHSHYCSNCGHMETTQEWIERCNAQENEQLEPKELVVE